MSGSSVTRMKNAIAVTTVLMTKPFTTRPPGWGRWSGCPEDSRSAQQESRPEGIARVERERVLARPEGRALDLGDDRRVGRRPPVPRRRPRPSNAESTIERWWNGCADGDLAARRAGSPAGPMYPNRTASDRPRRRRRPSRCAGSAARRERLPEDHAVDARAGRAGSGGRRRPRARGRAGAHVAGRSARGVPRAPRRRPSCRDVERAVERAAERRCRA